MLKLIKHIYIYDSPIYTYIYYIISLNQFILGEQFAFVNKSFIRMFFDCGILNSHIHISFFFYIFTYINIYSHLYVYVCILIICTYDFFTRIYISIYMCMCLNIYRSYHSFTPTIIIFLMVDSLSFLDHKGCKDTRSKFTQYLLLVGSTSLNNVAFVS